MDNNIDKNFIKLENGIYNPLDQRTEEDHAAHLKSWENFGLLNPDIMDYLTGLSEEGLDAVRSLLLLSGKDPITLNDNINNYMMIEGIVKGELEAIFGDQFDTDSDGIDGK